MKRMIIPVDGFEGLELRQFIGEIEESRAYLEILEKSRDDVTRYQQEWPFRDAEHETVASVMHAFQKQQPNVFSFGIWFSGTLVGKLHIVRSRFGDGNYWQIGGFTSPDYRRRGFGSAGRRALATWALTSLRCSRLDILTHPENIPVQKTILKAGFERNGVRVDESGRWLVFTFKTKP